MGWRGFPLWFVVLGSGLVGLACVYAAREISELRRQRRLLVDEIARARDLALRATNLHTAFVANVSHEIRTPLNVLLGLAQLLADEARKLGGIEVQSYVDGMEQASGRLTSKIRDIVDLARFESGTFPLDPKPMRLATILGGSADDHERRARAKGLVLTTVIEEPSAIVVFDEYCFRRAVDNLLDNAVKFTDSGRIDVRFARDRRGRLYVDVCDTGVGVDPQYVAMLFTAFSQEDPSSTRRYEGLGLGLALVRRYLEANGATIDVESRKGQGSRFRIVLGSGVFHAG